MRIGIERRIERLEQIFLPEPSGGREYAALSEAELDRRIEETARQLITDYEAQHGPLPPVPPGLVLTLDSVHTLLEPIFLALCQRDIREATL